MLLKVFGNSNPTEMNRNWASNTVGGLQITVSNFNSDLSVLLRLTIGGIEEINRHSDLSLTSLQKEAMPEHVQNCRHIHILCLIDQPIWLPVMYCLYYKITDWARSFTILIISALGQVSGGFYYGNLCGPTFNSVDIEVEKPRSPSFIFS